MYKGKFDQTFQDYVDYQTVPVFRHSKQSVLIIGYTVLLQCDVAQSETIQLPIYPCTRHVGNARVYRDYLIL